MIEPGRGLEPAVEEVPMTTPQTRETNYNHRHSEVSGFDLAPPPPPVASEPRFSAEEVEAMVKSEVARVLEEMHFQIQDRINHEMKQFTEEFIPKLAEKVIKDEIHRLLSNPPV
jgi:hypothetical protein